MKRYILKPTSPKADPLLMEYDKGPHTIKGYETGTGGIVISQRASKVFPNPDSGILVPEGIEFSTASNLDLEKKALSMGTVNHSMDEMILTGADGSSYEYKGVVLLVPEKSWELTEVSE